MASTVCFPRVQDICFDLGILVHSMVQKQLGGRNNYIKKVSSFLQSTMVSKHTFNKRSTNSYVFFLFCIVLICTFLRCFKSFLSRNQKLPDNLYPLAKQSHVKTALLTTQQLDCKNAWLAKPSLPMPTLSDHNFTNLPTRPTPSEWTCCTPNKKLCKPALNLPTIGVTKIWEDHNN